MNADKCRDIFRRLAIANPYPATELHHRSPFELLVAVILSAQATDKSVNLVTARLFPLANSPAAIVALGVEGLEQHIRSIGLYHTKARNIVATSQLLIERHASEVPQTREELEALPGVGRKTANVILNTAFGQPVIGVDTHVFRISNRLGLASGKTPLEVEQKLLQVIPGEYLRNAHHWLILHGRYVCVARKPRCGDCVIHELCEYKARELPA